MLAAYRQAAAARAALGIPPLPLTAQETAALVELLISPPADEDPAFLLDLLIFLPSLSFTKACR